MLSQLQGYLLQYGSVCIPSVGTFRLVHHPASLDVVNQQLLPPQAEVLFASNSTVPAHQLQSLSTLFNDDLEAAEQALHEFGDAMKLHLQSRSFAWQGMGSLSAQQGDISFIPSAEKLSPVPAYKVLRGSVQHAVLVGDQEQQRSAEDYKQIEEIVVKQKAPELIVALVIALLALCFIGYQLYNNGGRVQAAGLQQKVKVQPSPIQYK